MRIVQRMLATGLPGIVLFSGALLSCKPDREPVAPVEIQRPSTRAILPAPGSLIVSRGSAIRMAFDEGMNPGTFPGHFKLWSILGDTVPGIFQGVDTSVLFLPDQQLQPGTIYQGALRGRVRDLQNTSIGLNGDGVFDDTTLLMNTWFYTEGEYSTNGRYRIFLRDRKGEAVRVFAAFDSVGIYTGFKAPEGMALAVDGSELFVSSTGRDSVVFISTATNAEEKRIGVAAYPSSMAVSGTTLYVININGKAVTKIDITSKSVIAKYSLTFFPGRLAVSLDGQTLYTLDQSTGDLVLLRSTDGTVIKRLTKAVKGVIEGDIAVHPTTGTVYICNAGDFNVKTTDPAGGALQVLTSYPANVKPIAIAFDDAHYYVAAGKTLFKYDQSSGAVLASLTFASTVKSVTVIPTGELVYAPVNMSIVVLDAKTLTVLKEIPTNSSGLESIIASPNKFQ